MARSVQYSTIKSYLFAIKFYHSSHGYALNLSAFLRLQLILRGIKRSQGVNSKVPRPITLPILNLFYHLLTVKYTTNKDSLMVWAAMTLALFGFLRIGELTCDSHFNSCYWSWARCQIFLCLERHTYEAKGSIQCSIDPFSSFACQTADNCDKSYSERHLTLSNLVFMPKSSPKCMLVRLKVSKTDPFREGQTIVIGRANSNLCPISAMVTYLKSRSPFPNSGPLFTCQSGSFLTRGRFTSETRLLLSKGELDSSEFAGHSFRIGAVTTGETAWM